MILFLIAALLIGSSFDRSATLLLLIASLLVGSSRGGIDIERFALGVIALA